MEPLKDIFLKALKHESPEERRLYLRKACAGDDALLQRISQLLHHAKSSGEHPLDRLMDRWGQSRDQFSTLLVAGDSQPAGESDGESEVQCGTWIGPYRIEQLIGQGGMGAVYLAQQYDPIQRQVALKLSKPHARTRHWAERFEEERKALERMDHAGIARVLDAGATSEGAPYIVMELVRGVPITHYCRSRQMPPHQRLRLLVDVCRAVNHAHQKGIIHRDLKPSNILVAEQDGEPIVKVIDFGIAAAVDRAAEADELSRDWRCMAGTPQYMSPEQAAGRSDLVDTRSDVYALGLLLYELITDCRPRSSDWLDGFDGSDLNQYIRDQVMPRPSQRAARDSHHAAWLRFELDWIVMRAIEHDPERRYQGVGELADDLQRVLEDRPIRARPSSWPYRLRKLASKYRAAITAGVVLMAILVGATLFSGWQAIEARRARELSERLLFAADMKLASEAVRNGHIRHARDRLVRYLPQQGQVDRRNFAWNYLWNHLHPEVIASTTDSAVFDVRFSPDGDLLASGHDDGSVFVWESATGRKLQALEKHQTTVRRLAFSPSGHWLATASDDGQLRLWPIGDTSPAAVIAVCDDLIYDVLWVDDDYCATVGSREIRIWDCRPLDETPNSPDHQRPSPEQTADLLLAPRRFERAPATAYGLALSPDRKLLVSVSGSTSQFSHGLLRTWNFETGELDAEVSMDSKGLSVAFDPSRPRLFVGTQRGEIKVFDTTNLHRSPSRLEGHSGNVYHLACSPDQRWLVSAGKDATIRLWDLQSDGEARVIQCHDRRVYSANFSPTRPMLVSASADGTIRQFMLDRTPFRLLNSGEPAGAGLSGMEESNQSAPLANEWSLGIYRLGNYHVGSGSALLIDSMERVIRLSMASGETELLALSYPGNLDVSRNGWAVFGGELLNPPALRGDGHEREESPKRDQVPEAVVRAATEDGGNFTAFGRSGRLVWYPPAGKARSTPTFPRTALPTPDNRIWWSADSRDGEEPQRFRFNRGAGVLYACRIAADGQFHLEEIAAGLPNNALIDLVEQPGGTLAGLLAARPHSGIVSYYPLPENKQSVRQLSPIDIDTGLTDLTAVHGYADPHSEADYHFLVGDALGQLELYRVDDSGTGQLIQQFSAPTSVVAMDVSGRQGEEALYVAGPEGIFRFAIQGERWEVSSDRCLGEDQPAWMRPLPPTVTLYDLARKEVRLNFHPLLDTVEQVAVSPDGSQLALIGDWGMVRIFSSSGRLLATLDQRVSNDSQISFSPDGQLLFLSFNDDILAFETKNFRRIYRCEGHENSITDIVAGRENGLLASSSDDLSLRLWDRETGTLVGVLAGHTSIPEKICLSPDEKLLASVDRQGLVKLWDLDTMSELMELHDISEQQLVDGWPFQLEFASPTKLLLFISFDPQDLNGGTSLALGQWTVYPQ
jgi:eukaryotic-like serine/threonine-protein kinase